MTSDRETADGIVVKPLEWVKHPEAEMWRCDSIVGDYRVSAVSTASWSFHDNRGGFFHRDVDTLDAAKTAAQADYESRVRSALDTDAIEAALASVREEGANAERASWPAVAIDSLEHIIRMVQPNSAIATEANVALIALKEVRSRQTPTGTGESRG